MPNKKNTSPQKKQKVSQKSSKKIDSTPLLTPEVSLPTPTTSKNPNFSLPPLKLNPKVLAATLFLIGIGLLSYKLGPWLVPAVVDKTPITRWQLYQQFEKSYANQILEDMINEQILKAAIKKSDVKVEKARIDEELSKIEKQFESLGGLDEALKARGMTRADLIAQISTQLSVEEILKDKITPTDEEVKKYFDDNSRTLFKDKKFEEVREDIVSTLKQNKLRDQFMTWFTEIKKDIAVKNFSPSN